MATQINYANITLMYTYEYNVQSNPCILRYNIRDIYTPQQITARNCTIIRVEDKLDVI